jgi:hypothetical protein
LDRTSGNEGEGKESSAILGRATEHEAGVRAQKLESSETMAREVSEPRVWSIAEEVSNQSRSPESLLIETAVILITNC